MQPNKRNLLSVAVVAGLFVAVMLFGTIGNVRSGNYVSITIVFTALSICFLAIWLGHFRVRVMLRDKTPDRIIAHYHRAIRRIPHADAAAACLSALAAAFFGQFDRARRELETIDFTETTPAYRGNRLYVLAVLALLEETDYPKALRLADEARALASRDPAGAMQLLDDVIRLVAETAPPEPETLGRLERVAKKQHGLMPGMCAWALAVYFKRTDQPDKAADCKEFLRLSVPFCAPLIQPTPR